MCLGRVWTAELRSHPLPSYSECDKASHIILNQLNLRLDDETSSDLQDRIHTDAPFASDQLFFRSLTTQIHARGLPLHLWTADIPVCSHLHICEDPETTEPAGLGIIFSALQSGHSLTNAVTESAGASGLEYECGRGDKRSKKGKRFKHSHGKLRPSRGELARRLRAKWEISGPPPGTPAVPVGNVPDKVGQ